MLYALTTPPGILIEVLSITLPPTIILSLIIAGGDELQ